MLIALITLLSLLWPPSVAMAAGEPRMAIKTILSSSEPVQGEALKSRQTMLKFYGATNFAPVWVNDSGPLPRLGELLDALKDAPNEGLRPEHYHYAALQEAIKSAPRTLAAIEVLASDAFLTYGADIKGGRVNPGIIYEGKYNMRKRADATDALKRATTDGNIKAALTSLEPEHAGYDYLKKGLAAYRDIEAKGGWPKVPEGPTLRPGANDQRMAAVRKRLIVTGELQIISKTPYVYSPELATAVKAFQRRHGLDDDGVIGPATVKELNVSVHQRIRQLELNMERWRWFPAITGGRFILVNVTDFHMDVFEDFKPVVSMRVVVGKPLWDTPSFTSKLTRIVLNPTWNVPKNIAIDETIPSIIKDPKYLEKNNFSVIAGKPGAEKTLDPARIDWNSINEDNLNFRFQQAPGKKNPLGAIKFLFANSFEVYMHDTPSGSLFGRNVRTFSHGCIRLEKPMELAKYMLQNSPDWTMDKVKEVQETETETVINLKNPIEVHLFYLTAWVSEDGTVQFRRDFYERDEPLDEALSK